MKPLRLLSFLEPPPRTPGAVLARARKLIEQKGWTQGCFSDPAGGLCSTAAINHASGNTQLRRGAYTAFERANDMRPTSDWGQIVQWNDTQGRTKAEVIEAFARAESFARNR